MSFSCAEIERFYDALMALPGKYEALAAAYAGKRFENETARAFATQGFPRRRIVLSGPSVLSQFSLSGPRNRRQSARQNRNRDARPPWISSPPPPDSWRSLRRAAYPLLQRRTPPSTNPAAPGSLRSRAECSE